MIRRPPRSTPLYSSAASDVYKRQFLLFIVLQSAAQTDLCDPKVFDWRFYVWHYYNLQYASKYPTRDLACDHWNNVGSIEGRMATTLFYSHQYCRRNPDMPGCNETEQSHQKAVIYYLNNESRPRHGYLLEGATQFLVIANDVIAIMATRKFGGAISSITYKGTTMLVSSGRIETNFQLYFNGVLHNETELAIEGGMLSDWNNSGVTSTEVTCMKTIPDSEIITIASLKTYHLPGDAFELKKSIKLNVEENPNLFSIEYEFETHKDYLALSIYVPFMNLISNFSELYEIDVESRTYHALRFPPDNSSGYYAYKPVICAIPGVVAIGAAIKEIEGPKGSATYVYQTHLDAIGPLYERMFLIPHYYAGGGAPAGTRIKIKTHIAVGTVEEVTEALSRP
eukprot:TRINITY_DN9453_c0_g7_i1.p1 TRINITY_DN9453_c0_g7~~TRINITY_DN9453_c0_g7_i1.p1  ORF type:complete len:416 (-),score=37.07 TRINITY_DN9453_c0_g7_i1:149-1336(-)